MKRLLLILGIMLAVFTIAACDGEEEDVSIDPTFERLVVAEREPDESPYVREKQESVLVEIHLDNPSNLPVNTVTINDRVYRVNSFLEGTTPQMVMLEINVRSLTGLTEYEVQRIEYTDGVQVRALDVGENNTFSVFVLRSLPNANISNARVDTEAVMIDVALNDPDGVVIDDTARATLYNVEDTLLENPLETKSLDIGFNALTFDGLLSATSYKVIVEVDYDRGDGEGVQTDYELTRRTPLMTLAKTPPTGVFADVNAEETAITFDLDFNDPDTVLVDGNVMVEVTRDGDEIATVPINDFDHLTHVVDGLFNNTTYTLRLLATFNLNDGAGDHSDVVLAETSITTLELPVPTLDASLTSFSRDNVIFSIDTASLEAIDGLEAGSLEATLYRVDEDEEKHVIAFAPLFDGAFRFEVERLLADMNVYVEMTAKIDLGDGQGALRRTVYETTFTTNAFVRPSGSISAITLSQSSISVNVNYSDPGTALPESFYAVLTINDSDEPIIKTLEGSGTYVFDNLEVRKDDVFTIKIYSGYDLLDGSGPQEDILLDIFSKTASLPQKPELTIDVITPTYDSVDVAYTLLDFDGTVVSETLKIIDTAGNTVDNESNLLANTEYTVLVEIEYDLQDGAAPRMLRKTETFSTLSYQVPMLAVEIADINKTSVIFDLSVDDPDGIATIDSMVLKQDGLIVDTADDPLSLVFTELLSGVNYEFVVVLEYDLRDGSGLNEQTLLIPFTTEALREPSVNIDFSDVRTHAFGFDFVIDDPDGIAHLESIRLWRDNEVIESLDDLSKRELFGLLSDSTYALRVELMYDLNDGEGSQTAVFSRDVTTNALRRPTISIEDLEVDLQSVSVTVVALQDVDFTIEPGSLAFVVLQDGVVVDAVNIDNIDDAKYTLTALLPDTNYALRAIADVDFNDDVERFGYVLFERSFRTPAISGSHSISSISETRAVIRVNMEAFDGVVDFDSLHVTLTYEERDEILASGNFKGAQTFTIDAQNLLADQTLRVTVTGDKDIDGVPTNDTLYSFTVQTPANALPSATFSNVNFDTDAIEATLTITDASSVLIDDSVRVMLYDGDGVLLDETVSDGGLVRFDGLDLSKQTYYVLRVEGDYYLRDGKGIHTDKRLGPDYAITDVRPDAPNASIDNIVVNQNSIVFDVTIEDPFETIVPNSRFAVLFENGVEVDRFAINDASSVVFDALDAATNYTIQIIADYDIHEATIIEAGVLTQITQTTLD